MLRDMGEGVGAAASVIHLATTELHGGDLALAEDELRREIDFLRKAGEEYHLSSIVTLLGQVVRDQGRDEEALRLLTNAEELSSPDDVESQALWRSVCAPILARAGAHAKAEELARSAVELLKETEGPGTRADAVSELATVLYLIGKTEEALRMNDAAIELYETKGILFSANRRRNWADSIRP